MTIISPAAEMPKSSTPLLYSAVAERSLVALCMTFNTAREEALLVLGGADFGSSRLRHVYEALIQLHEQGLEVDLLTILEQLKMNGQLESVGGEEYLRQIIADIPGNNPKNYIRTIADYAVRRKVHNMGDHMQAMAADPSVGVHELINQINQKSAAITLPDEQGLAVPIAEVLQREEEEYDWVIPGLLERKDRTIIVAPEGYGKALALNTPIMLFGGGWTTMGAINVGDVVCGPQYEPRKVIACTPVLHNRLCTMLQFEDGTEIVADWDHQWPVSQRIAPWVPSACTYQLMDSGTIHRLLQQTEKAYLANTTDMQLVGMRIIASNIIKSEDVRCIQIDNADGIYLAGKNAVPTHNSTLLRQVAVMAAGGLHPFDAQRRIPPIRTLIVDVENRERQIRRRMAPMVDAVSYTLGGDESWMNERCHIWIASAGINLRNRTDVGNLVATVRQVKPDLITIGPLYKMASGNPNDEEVAKSISEVLDMITVQYNVAMLIEAHAGHGSGPRREMRPFGASMWIRWPEFGLGLYPSADGGMDVEHWRGQREDRAWPTRLIRGKNWSWEVPTDQLASLDEDNLLSMGTADAITEDF